ncbi:MAG: hypothetical protein NZ518_07540, partial [Dehalococcoidia bacterium]|nr:hypothetical protein [Dehalococcoidia bacterium]
MIGPDAGAPPSSAPLAPRAAPHRVAPPRRRSVVDSAWVNAIGLFVYRTLTRLIQWLPLSLVYRIGEMVADVVFYGVWREKRAVVIDNMRRVLGPTASPAQVERAARNSVRNYAKYVVEFARFPALSRETII